MKRSYWIAGILLLLLPGLLTSCANRRAEVHTLPQNHASEKIELTFFGNKVEVQNVEIIEKILNNYMKEHPNVVITYESAKGNAYFELLDKRLRSGNGDDIFMINHDAVLQHAAQGHLKELSSLPELNRFSALSLEQMRDEAGAIYYVPTTISAFGLYCNLDLLAAHQQPVPLNYREFTAVCDYFAGKGVTPVVANNDISLKTLALAVSEYPLREAGTIAETYEKLNRGEMRLSDFLEGGFAMVAEWIRKGYVNPETTLATAKTKDDLAQFARGEAPFMLTGAWAAGTVREQAGFRFAIHPYPILDGGNVLVINTDTRLSVNSHSKHAAQAIDFVRFFLREENLDQFARNQSSFTPLKDGKSSARTEILPLYEALQAERYIIGADEKLNLPIWQATKEAAQMLLRGESWNAAAAHLDRTADN